ncbi:MAG TPA: hypothetical protein DFR83_00760 [Deltaproteobacteria bacterium]|nr:hypothetical protein [Deltaproteobacteria bacterium]
MRALEPTPIRGPNATPHRQPALLPVHPPPPGHPAALLCARPSRLDRHRRSGFDGGCSRHLDRTARWIRHSGSRPRGRGDRLAAPRHRGPACLPRHMAPPRRRAGLGCRA